MFTQAENEKSEVQKSNQINVHTSWKEKLEDQKSNQTEYYDKDRSY